MFSERDVHSSFSLFPTFLLSVPLLVVIWAYPEQGYNSATGHFVWLVRSAWTVYHWTFIWHLHYQHSKRAEDTSVFLQDVALSSMSRYVSPINPAVFPHLSVVLLSIGIFFMAWFFVYPLAKRVL